MARVRVRGAVGLGLVLGSGVGLAFKPFLTRNSQFMVSSLWHRGVDMLEKVSAY